ncbi:MAG: hypothetical protein ACD_73C00223G0001, partial [uncultured bacterium]
MNAEIKPPPKTKPQPVFLPKILSTLKEYSLSL